MHKSLKKGGHIAQILELCKIRGEIGCLIEITILAEGLEPDGTLNGISPLGFTLLRPSNDQGPHEFMIGNHALIRRSSQALQCNNKALEAGGLIGGEGKGKLAEEFMLEFEMNANEGSSELKHEGRVVGVISIDRFPVFCSNAKIGNLSQTNDEGKERGQRLTLHEV